MNIRSVLEKMIAARASDLHVKIGTPPVVRVDGVLYTLDEPPPGPDDLKSVVAQLLNDEQRLYFSTHHEIGSPALALRHVPVDVPTIEDLQLPTLVRELAFAPRGLILVTGRTGSGKSTTLAAMIDALNRVTTRNVITVEDPIEFLHRDRMSFIHQREVGLDTRSFHEGLRYVLRQDPDIILVGEIRDLETMSTALMAADTGHLVLSTLHTTDVVQTLQRVISFYPPHQHDEIRMSLAANLRAVICQRLVPRRDGAGRAPAVEIMVNTQTIREFLLNPEKLPLIHSAVAEGVTQYGMQTFDQSVLGLLQSGVITEEEAIRNCNNPNELSLKLKGISATSDRLWQAVESGKGGEGGATSTSSPAASGGRPDWMSKI
ncbi:MAG: PilT/PilU family type 4a pilus ATPase [Candidatus Eisenbacteria bacterium]|uniref:PilT/PilU family type 4a pilus ATPase n=1 Tax=Eiseniibacteriota bacterium TaxID=2212470 RepID=A0A538U510_UNCEI|nr:MAG: PilT/PilU family type 4a pilus ATPase [Candidatus Eisenbacteria bacterium]